MVKAKDLLVQFLRLLNDLLLILHVTLGWCILLILVAEVCGSDLHFLPLPQSKLRVIQ